MEQNKKQTITDFISIVKRRRWGIMLPFTAFVLLSVVVILIWDPVYRSTATILIEEQDIPREYVMATVTSYAEHRLQAINQRIMSSARLLEIINRFDLYSDKRRRLTIEEIIEDMRKKDIRLETITADVVDPRSGRPTEATIAFTLSYEGKNPVVVQKVANVLASLYLEENIRVTGQQTAGATKFLEAEMISVRSNLLALEREISAFKERNPKSLPELFQFNLQSMDWSERNYMQLKDQLRTLREKESYLSTQLATIAPDTANQDKERLKELRVLLVSLNTRFSDEYPDVIKTKAEIGLLEKKLQSADSQPEISGKPDNPAYIALSSQLASIQSDIDSTMRQIEELDNNRDEYRQRLEKTPRVEEGYKNLLVERNNTQAKYDDLMKKFMEAKVAHGLEEEQMGERFTLIDPPRLPEKPVRPNQPIILLIGLMLGLGAAAGTASLQEASDKSVRRSEDLLTSLRFPVLAEIPEIVTEEDLARQKRRRNIILGTVIFSLAVIVMAIHFLVKDLDILWARFVRLAGW